MIYGCNRNFRKDCWRKGVKSELSNGLCYRRGTKARTRLAQQKNQGKHQARTAEEPRLTPGLHSRGTKARTRLAQQKNRDKHQARTAEEPRRAPRSCSRARPQSHSIQLLHQRRSCQLLRATRALVRHTKLQKPPKHRHAFPLARGQSIFRLASAK